VSHVLCAETWSSNDEASDEESEEEEEYMVEAILGERMTKGGKEYHIQWEGWGDVTTWEPAANLAADNPVLVEYLTQKA
jgi:hypothetical protein